MSPQTYVGGLLRRHSSNMGAAPARAMIKITFFDDSDQLWIRLY
jgi:hypothetical protein